MAFMFFCGFMYDWHGCLSYVKFTKKPNPYPKNQPPKTPTALAMQQSAESCVNPLYGFQSLKQVFFFLSHSSSIVRILVPAILSILSSVVDGNGILISIVKLLLKLSSSSAACSPPAPSPNFLLQLYPEMFFVLFSVQSLFAIIADPGWSYCFVLVSLLDFYRRTK